MTAASPAGTPLILIVLSLGISFLAAMGSIAAVLMARANLQRQIQVAARETWIREFREQVVTLMAAKAAPGFFDPDDQSRGGRRQAEITDRQHSAYFALCVLIAEKGTEYEAFAGPLKTLLSSTGKEEDAREFVAAVVDILRRERAAIETDWAVRWQPWLQLKAWCRRGPPRFPDLP